MVEPVETVEIIGARAKEQEARRKGEVVANFEELEENAFSLAPRPYKLSKIIDTIKRKL